MHNANDPEFFVILNTASGDDTAGRSPQDIKACFTDRGRTCLVRPVGAGDDFAQAVSEARKLGVACVVAAGGDGTICGTAGALIGTNIELGVIPLGTFNYFARRFDIPQDVDAAVEVICRDRSQLIDIGSVNGRSFLNNASLGLYVSILKRRELIYRSWGRSRLAAYWSVLVALATVYRPLTMKITIDEKVERAKSPMIFVAASAYQLDEFDIEGADAIRKGEFAVLLAPNCGRFNLIVKALSIALRGARKDRDFTLLTGKHIIVETRRSASLVVRDGERERMNGPYEFRLAHNAISLRVPDAVPTEGSAS